MPEDLTEETKAVWRHLTGTDPGDDPVLVGSVMTYPSLVLPRGALVEILHAIARMRAAAATRPRLPPAVTPASVDAAVRPPAQLFTQTPTDQPPSELERVALGDVEDLAVALDAAQANAKTEDDRAAVAEMRRLLLGKLELHGLMDEARAPEKRAFLEGFRLPTLRDYVDAACALRAYYRGATRATYTLGPAPEHLLDGNVSLDWFRVPNRTPEGATPESWLAYAEHVLHGQMPSGAGGDIPARSGAQWYRIQWRRDRDQPAVVAWRAGQGSE